jgi:hypothetical protein
VLRTPKGRTLSTPHAHRGRIGGLESWARTVDRTARTAPARRNSPVGIEWHLARLGDQFDHATDEQRLAAAEASRRAYFARLAANSAAARARKQAS